ncbi:MAG: hypothetical protein GY906_11785, partial [bacterium]|nr:hypothetical protein [bacterium]
LRNPEEPKCRQRWGWILIWPVLATPAFQVAQVEATAYRVDPAQVSSSLFFIPETRSEQAQLVEKILDTSSMNSETK